MDRIDGFDIWGARSRCWGWGREDTFDATVEVGEEGQFADAGAWFVGLGAEVREDRAGPLLAE